jgi:hypothetical protein
MRRSCFLALLLASIVACSGGAASSGSGEAPEPTDEGLPRPTLRLLVTTDLEGYLEPCGCQQRPLGGIDKLATALAEARRDGTPTLFLHAGDLLFDGLSHSVRGADASAQEGWKAETLVDILSRLGLAAATAGPLDARQGVGTLRRLAGQARFPLLAANAQFDGTPLHDAPVVHDVGGLKVGIFGVADLTGADGRVPEGLSATKTLEEAAKSEVARLRAQGATLVVGLVRASRRDARALATGTPGLDFLIQGGLAEGEPIVPSRAGDTITLNAARQGHGLLVVDVYRRGEGAFADISAWTRTRERARLAESIDALRARIAEWERSGHAQADLDAQKARLAAMEREREALRARPTPGGNAFAARFVELSPDVRGEPEIARIVDRYDERVNAHNKVAFANLLPRPVAPGQPHYVGAETCRSCHAAEYTWWRTTPHGRAYATLTNLHKEYNLSCVGCHVTGYNQPGGSTVTHHEGLVDVGCETCHGPGSAHAADGGVPVARVDVPETVCVQCHNEEHSDRFHYPTYRRLLIAPGHGQ